MTQEIDASSIIALVLLALLYWNIWDSLRLFTPPDEKAKKQGSADRPVVSTPKTDLDITDATAGAVTNCADGASDAILAIQLRDATFDVARFLVSAGNAYETIVTAFAEGNLGTLRRLVSSDVYDAFSAEIAAREREGLEAEADFVRIEQPRITAADIVNDSALITVHFVSELFNVTRNPAGHVVGGTQSPQMTEDSWTFAKTLKPRADAWTLVAANPHP